MPRISSYSLDTDITKSDKLLGTSSGTTKNFSIQDMTKYLGSTGVTGNFCSQFVNNSSSQQNGQMTIAGMGSAASKPFAQINSIILSEFCFDKTDTALARLNHFNGKEIIISQVDNPNNFGLYKVDSITPVSGTTTHTLALTHKSGNGSITNLENYSITTTVVDSDKHEELEFTSNTFVKVNGALQFETINGSSMCYVDFEHNLNKKPAISAEQEGSPGQVAMMPVKYINNNKVRVYFSGTTSGKIFAN